MPPIPKVPVRVRECVFCGGDFTDRGPGSGIRRDVCSVDCERAGDRARAQRADRERRARQQRNRTGRDGEQFAWPLTVFELYGADCLSCGADAQEAHHIVPRSVITNAAHLTPAKRQALEFDPINGFPTCTRCHEGHTQGSRRFYYEMLPSPAVSWAMAHRFDSRVFDPRVYLGAPSEVPS